MAQLFEALSPRALVRGKAYVNLSGGWPSKDETLYFATTTEAEGYRCDRCGKWFEKGMKAYAFDFRSDLDGRLGGIVLGSECVKKLSAKEAP